MTVVPNGRRDSIAAEALSRLVEQWKPVLGLTEWTISVELMEFERGQQNGQVKIDGREKNALVVMARRPIHDEERVLVRLLAHVMLWPLRQAVSGLTEAGRTGFQGQQLEVAVAEGTLEPFVEQITVELFHAADRERDMAEVPDIGVVWRRIEAAAGQTFRQIRGGEFTYEVRGNSLSPDRTDRMLPRSHFGRALELVPLEDTVPVQHLQGPSYIYAILMDPRIRQSDW